MNNAILLQIILSTYFLYDIFMSVTGIDVEIAIITIAAICTFYTALVCTYKLSISLFSVAYWNILIK